MNPTDKQVKTAKFAFWGYSTGLFTVIILSVLWFGKSEDAKFDARVNELITKSRFPEYNPNVPALYNGATFITKPQIKTVRVALTVSPQTVDISGTGFTNVYAVVPQGENNTATVTAMPNCSLKSFTSTSAIINTTVAQSTTVSILGVNIVGLATPTVFTGMYVDLIVIGN